MTPHTAWALPAWLAAPLLIAAATSPGASPPAAAADKCTLVVGGRAVTPATHVIVLPAAPSPQERYAAADLQAHLQKLTGGRLEVVAEGAAGARTPMVVGRAEAALAALGVKVDFQALGPEGIVLRTKGPAVVLAGNRRGVIYATSVFLEEQCGIRWLTPDCTVIPTGRRIEVPSLSVRYIPPLEYRATDYPRSRPAAWAVHNRINGTQTQLTEREGGKIAYSHFVHTFNSILNPAEHFAAHPEWFSEIDGRRVGGRTQLCLTNPEVLARAKQVVRQWIKDAPQATIFSVSQNDWHNYCRCPRCEALAKKEGAQSGPLLHFVNAIADDIARDYPDKLISTLAYQYTRTPPRHVRPRPNVCIRLCSIECCFAHPLESCPVNRSFVEDIRNWNRICKRLYVWDYVINYSHSVQPFPNLYSIAPNIRFFLRNGVKGIYEEACYFTVGSELAELRTWIIAKTLWRPDYDTDRAIDEFLAGYYGPAAGHIRAYINLLHRQVREHADWHANIWSPPTAPYLNGAFLGQASRLFDAAEAAVKDDPARLHRVRVARLPVLYVRICTAKGDAAGLIDRFEAVARKEGLTTLRENRRSGALETWLKKVRADNEKRRKSTPRGPAR